MAEKMFGITHLISETKLLALIASNADEVKVDIFVPERRGPKRLQQSGQQSGSNGHAPQLMLDAPIKNNGHRRTSAAALAKQWGTRKWGARQIVLKMLYDNQDRLVTMTEFSTEAARFGVSVHAVYAALTPLLKEGKVERPARSQYKILKPGIEYVAAREASSKQD